MKNFVKSKIVELSHLNENYLKLKLELKIKNLKTSPGQFLMLSLEEIDQTIPRPFGILNQEGNFIEILVKKVGKVTKKIFELKAGDNLNLLLPLGNSFKKENNLILVSGGYGISPIFYYLKSYGISKNTFLFYGAKSKNDLIFFKDLKKLMGKNFYFSTEDGSLGFKGLITEILEEFLKKEKEEFKIYGCGPIGMLKKINEISLKFNKKAYVSIDSMMGCGFGICLGCTVPTKSGNLFGCKDGPIFDSSIILWEKIV